MNQDRLTAVILESFAGSHLVDDLLLDELSFSLLDAQSRLQALDESGRWWRPGLYARTRALAPVDPRYSFTAGLANSMWLGERMIDTLCEADQDSSQAFEAAALLHLLVTAFDGICDEVPALMPDVLPFLQAAVAAFPAVNEAETSADNPLVEFTCSVVTALLRRLASGLSRASGVAARDVSQALRFALDSQIATVRVSPTVPPQERLARRTAVATGITQLTVMLPGLFNADHSLDPGLLHEFAYRLGDFFAWVDDLADLESDVRRRYLNGVAAFMAIDDCEALRAMSDSDSRVRAVQAVTNTKWESLLQAIRRAGLDGGATARTLAGCAAGWFGLEQGARALNLRWPAESPARAGGTPFAATVAESTRR
jgi:hypothetical protein